MHDLFEEIKDFLYDIGINWRELRTHSTRKGVGSGRQCKHCGPTDCCLVSASGLEARRCEGDYLFRQDAGDLNVGRRAACLDIETKEFANQNAQDELACIACYDNDNMSKVKAFNNPRNKLEIAKWLEIA